MKHINRLLTIARAARNGPGMHVLGFLDYDLQKYCYTANGTIWNGIPGTGEEFHSEHETAAQALAACEAIAARYPGCENIIFYLDYEDGLETGENRQLVGSG